MVVKVEPTKVFIPISLPSTIKATIINEKLIPINILAGEKLKNALRITEIPLVPPSSNKCGKIKSTVLVA